jgi:hypothetical protein
VGYRCLCAELETLCDAHQRKVIVINVVIIVVDVRGGAVIARVHDGNNQLGACLIRVRSHNEFTRGGTVIIKVDVPVSRLRGGLAGIVGEGEGHELNVVHVVR